VRKVKELDPGVKAHKRAFKGISTLDRSQHLYEAGKAKEKRDGS